MNKTILLGAAAIAALAAAWWAFRTPPRDETAEARLAEPELREEKTTHEPVVAEVEEASQDPEEQPPKDYVPCTDYARPEDVPWEVFNVKTKSAMLHLRPNRVLEDGTVEYRDFPMLIEGKRCFVTMTAKPIPTSSMSLADEPGHPSRQQPPVSIPDPGGD